MILQQYYLGCLSHASYLLADPKSGSAVVVDPQRDVDQYLADADKLGLRITDVVLTHFHADFVAGHLELRERAGARIHLGARAQAEYAFVPAQEGAVLERGALRLQFLETPGHTPESICVLVFDLEQDAERPHAVLTGDTLFIGDVGRPDLMASIGVTGEELAGLLYDSLHEKLLHLPDGTLVYPAHGAGSMCGKSLSKERVSTIGEQRRYNYALQPMTKADFIRLVTMEQPEAPAYFPYDAMLNRSERPSLETTLEKVLQPLPLEEVLRLHLAGAQVLDVRDPGDYAGAHFLGSTNVGLQGQFASWCGTLLRRDRPIVLIAETGKETEAALRLGRIGFDHVAGYLEGGMQALEQRPDLLRHTERITAQALAERLNGDDPPHVLDVRTDAEREAKRIVGSVHVPLHQLAGRVAEVPRSGHVVIHCGGGYRSMIAASLLEQQGFTNCSDLVGGYAAWDLLDERSMRATS
ncbi:MAG TPA: MBL fold metallo-hydrolase [Candidatus Krumholzibacteria bacterium]|nr:MBL fold metallo-hydrolase [Candidatus Krumholzibacteria bacterium]